MLCLISLNDQSDRVYFWCAFSLFSFISDTFFGFVDAVFIVVVVGGGGGDVIFFVVFILMVVLLS